MRSSTSWLPLFAAVVVLSMAGLLILRSFSLDAKGSGGPMLVSGIFPFTEDYLPSPDPESLQLRTTVQEPSGEDLARLPGLRLGDRRLGIEDAPWEEIVLVAEDRHPATAAVIRGLAEIITGQHSSPRLAHVPSRYPVVILQPLDGDTLPLGCHRMIRIASSGSIPESRDGVMDLRVVIAQQDLSPSFPIADAWSLWPATSVNDIAVTITHYQEAVTNVAWGPRFAAAGRSIAEAALSHLVDGGVISPHADDWPLTAIHGPWEGQIPQQPDHDVIRWYASNQAPLIRGWVGSIIGRRVFYRGAESDSMGVFASHLARGQWEAQHTAASNQDLQRGEWRNQREGSLQRLWAFSRSHGWDLLGVEANPQAGPIFRQWLEEAASDPVARGQLRRHLLTPGIDLELREQARRVLRQNPCAMELAMLGEWPDAHREEKLSREWSRWVLGRSLEMPEQSFSSESAAAPWDGRTRLIAMSYNGKERGAALVRKAGDSLNIRWRERDGAVQVFHGSLDQWQYGELFTIPADQ